MSSSPTTLNSYISRILLGLLLAIIIAFVLGGYQMLFGEDDFVRVVHKVEKFKNSLNAADHLNGLDINAKSHELHGSTALIWFSRMGDAKAVEMLLSAGADVSAVNALGRTAADEARINGNIIIYQLLTPKSRLRP